jgi:SAM-dependent methyltransferase
MQNKWDKKAHRYGRYTPEGDHLERIICDLMEEMGVDFERKSVVDIGCGTGIYTLRIAQRAAHVDALDISEEMIKILEGDASGYGIDNVHAFHSDWEAFALPEKPYDYALSTMSPATRDAAGFAKMHRCAQTKIFLGWGAKRGTILLEELIAAHGATYTPPNGAVRLKEWLEAENIPYDLEEYPEQKVRSRPLAKAIDAYTWHLNVRDLTPDRERIEAILRKHMDGEGNVVERVVNYFNLIVWA